MKIVSGSVLGACLLASCAQIATGRSPYQPFGDPLGEKGGPKGRFWGARKSENGSKTDVLPLDGHFGPLKMPSGSGSGNNVKMDGFLT